MCILSLFPLMSFCLYKRLLHVPRSLIGRSRKAADSDDMFRTLNSIINFNLINYAVLLTLS